MATEDSGSLKDQKVLRWTTTVLEDGDELVLPLPLDMCEAVGWEIGDTLKWQQLDEKTWSLQKSAPSEPEGS